MVAVRLDWLTTRNVSRPGCGGGQLGAQVTSPNVIRSAAPDPDAAATATPTPTVAVTPRRDSRTPRAARPVAVRGAAGQRAPTRSALRPRVDVGPEGLHVRLLGIADVSQTED